METSLLLPMFISFLFLNFKILVSSSTTNSMPPPICHAHESSALLQFKHSFTFESSSKVKSWRPKDRRNCCFWNGVQCDNVTGHVIGLDLSSSGLHGSINSTSTLFQLVHLRSLNLAYNDFNGSPVPSKLDHLSSLTYLNLSFSGFSGIIPLNILKISKLSVLDLSFNDGLFLKEFDFSSLVQSFTSLEHLYLDFVDISSTVPQILSNISSLQCISLESCGLIGEFPVGIFQLPKLRYIRLYRNWDLRGYLPEFNSSTLIQQLELGRTSFSGSLPSSVGSLGFLTKLDLSSCSFSGQIPASLGNLSKLDHLDLSKNNFVTKNFSTLSWIGKLTRLTVLALVENSLRGDIPSSFANLTQLSILFLSRCKMNGQIPAILGRMTQLTWLILDTNELQGPIPYSISQLTKLTHLDLSDNYLVGPIPYSISQLTKLTYLGLAYNSLVGPIPYSISQLTKLTFLDLGGNNLVGPLPASILQLKHLESLHLYFNNLSGTVELDKLLILKNLTTLVLSGNKFSVVANVTIARKFLMLGLGSCNLKHFPNFLRDQNQLQWLDLSKNNIHGVIPKYIWEAPRETLQVLDLSSNFLTGFEEFPAVFPGTKLVVIYLSYNRLQGQLPILPPSTRMFSVQGNNFTGEVSPLICKLHNLLVLELAENHLSGKLPECLGNFSNSLQLLNLRSNKFQGEIPQTYTKGCSLRMYTLDYNNLEGQVPRSLANCTRLKFLSIGHNKLSGMFPSWFGSLQELNVLVLRSNQFHGTMTSLTTNSEFPALKIVDISQNNFSGQLPMKYFLNWNAMKVVDTNVLTYMGEGMTYGLQQGMDFFSNTPFSMSIINKGTEIDYERVPESFAVIDLSSNAFEGHIPEVIGDLKGLHLLNLSHNMLRGPIPSSFENLRQLECLDLSGNKLSGGIPRELTQLNFLAVFNVSNNNLTGSIPKGNQFDTFSNDSYQGNLGLCGFPLSRTCGIPPVTHGDQQPGGSDLHFGWQPVVIGYGFGLLLGLVMGWSLVTIQYEWFLKTFRLRQPTRKRRSRRTRVRTH